MTTGTYGHRHEPAAPQTGFADAARQAAERARDVQLRQAAVERMRAMSWRHALHAWDQRYRDPIAPYGLAFLYADEPRPRHDHGDTGGSLRLTAATKLWLAGPETADLPRLLFDLLQTVAADAAKPGYDVTRDLANRRDDEMQRDAFYIGLGVSSLDTHTGSWEHARDRAVGVADVPGVIRIVLIDGTIIICDRRGASEFNRFTVHSSHALSLAGPLDSPYPYSAVDPSDIREDTAHGQVLRWMEELSALLWRLDTARDTPPRRRQP
jgi:hypothetical protein